MFYILITWLYCVLTHSMSFTNSFVHSGFVLWTFIRSALFNCVSSVPTSRLYSLLKLLVLVLKQSFLVLKLLVLVLKLLVLVLKQSFLVLKQSFSALKLCNSALERAVSLARALLTSDLRPNEFLRGPIFSWSPEDAWVVRGGPSSASKLLEVPFLEVPFLEVSVSRFKDFIGPKLIKVTLLALRKS